MSEPVPKVRCDSHGMQDETFVCQHIFESLRSRVPVGFIAAADPDTARPDAWCSACEKARIEAGGEWTEEVNALLNIRLLCGVCYDYAKEISASGESAAH